MTGYFNVMLVLQSRSDSLHILTGSSSDTNATSSDRAYHVGNVKFEEDLDMPVEEGKVNVNTEKDIGSEEEECMYNEEEEEENVDIKEEVSLEDRI